MAGTTPSSAGVTQGKSKRQDGLWFGLALNGLAFVCALSGSIMGCDAAPLLVGSVCLLNTFQFAAAIYEDHGDGLVRFYAGIGPFVALAKFYAICGFIWWYEADVAGPVWIWIAALALWCLLFAFDFLSTKSGRGPGLWLIAYNLLIGISSSYWLVDLANWEGGPMIGVLCLVTSVAFALIAYEKYGYLVLALYAYAGFAAALGPLVCVAGLSLFVADWEYHFSPQVFRWSCIGVSAGLWVCFVACLLLAKKRKV